MENFVSASEKPSSVQRIWHRYFVHKTSSHSIVCLHALLKSEFSLTNAISGGFCVTKYENNDWKLICFQQYLCRLQGRRLADNWSEKRERGQTTALEFVGTESKNTFIYLHLETETNNYNRIGNIDWWLHNNEESESHTETAIESKINTGKFLTLWHSWPYFSILLDFLAQANICLWRTLYLFMPTFLLISSYHNKKCFFNYRIQNFCETKRKKYHCYSLWSWFSCSLQLRTPTVIVNFLLVVYLLLLGIDMRSLPLFVVYPLLAIAPVWLSKCVIIDVQWINMNVVAQIVENEAHKWAKMAMQRKWAF